MVWNMKIIFLTGAAGFIGTLARYSSMRIMNHFLPSFPFGTLFVNVTGAFLAGFLFILCRNRFQGYEAYFPILFIGFLGAFTTFSTFALESSRYLFEAQYLNLGKRSCAESHGHHGGLCRNPYRRKDFSGLGLFKENA